MSGRKALKLRGPRTCTDSFDVEKLLSILGPLAAPKKYRAYDWGGTTYPRGRYSTPDLRSLDMHREPLHAMIFVCKSGYPNGELFASMFCEFHARHKVLDECTGELAMLPIESKAKRVGDNWRIMMAHVAKLKGTMTEYPGLDRIIELLVEPTRKGVEQAADTRVEDGGSSTVASMDFPDFAGLAADGEASSDDSVVEMDW